MFLPAIIPTGFRVKSLGDFHGRGVLDSYSLESEKPGSDCAEFQYLNLEYKMYIGMRPD